MKEIPLLRFFALVSLLALLILSGCSPAANRVYDGWHHSYTEWNPDPESGYTSSELRYVSAPGDYAELGLYGIFLGEDDRQSCFIIIAPRRNYRPAPTPNPYNHFRLDAGAVLDHDQTMDLVRYLSDCEARIGMALPYENGEYLSFIHGREQAKRNGVLELRFQRNSNGWNAVGRLGRDETVLSLEFDEAESFASFRRYMEHVMSLMPQSKP
jgi:hypothetical protein